MPSPSEFTQKANRFKWTRCREAFWGKAPSYPASASSRQSCWQLGVPLRSGGGVRWLLRTPLLLVGDMIGGSGQEDLNKRAEDVSSIYSNTYVSVPRRLPLRLLPTKGSPSMVLTSITVSSCDVVINFWICGVWMNGPNETRSNDGRL